MPRKGSFDADAFYSALDGQRQARELTWKKVAEESGVSASTLTRIAQGKAAGCRQLSCFVGLVRVGGRQICEGRVVAKGKGGAACKDHYISSQRPALERRGGDGIGRTGQSSVQEIAKVNEVRMRRGFKTEAKWIAKQVRDDLGLSSTDPLDPWKLAELLEIPVIRLSEFQEFAERASRYFSEAGQSVFSAVTVFDENRRLIVHNDSHSPGRQASNVCHELAHGLLLHAPTPALDDKGCRYWSKEIEEEANWLSGVLLVPDEAAIAVVRRGIDLVRAAPYYGVSVQMMTYRINVSGARKRVRRFSRTSRQSIVRAR